MHVKLLSLSLILIISLFANGCTTKLSSEDLAKSKINDILYKIQDNFTTFNIDELMTCYHQDFYHKGKNKNQEQTIWEDRRAQYNYMIITDVKILINDNRAMVSFVLKYSNEQTQDIFIEPEDFGDISYFIKENGEWKIYGNQSEQ